MPPPDWLLTSCRGGWWPATLDGMVLFIGVFNLVFSYNCGEYKAVDKAQKDLYTIVHNMSVYKRVYEGDLSFG